MRDLASVVTVESVQKMFEKDRIVCARMVENSYEVIVPNTYKPGDKLVFIQEGAVLPETPTWEFLRKRCYKESWKGFLISPIVMGKKEDIDENGNPVAGERVRSWGLAVGLDECGLTEEQIKKLKAGDDITDLLSIRKYEPEEDASPKPESKRAYPKWVKFCLSHVMLRWIGKIWQRNHQNTAGGFPTSEIQKSDETTLQNSKGVLTKFPDSLCYVSCKLEGQSATTGFDVVRNKKTGDIKKIERFYPCSRNNAYKLKCNNTFWKWCEVNDIENKLRKYYKDFGKLLMIQAEQCGPGIQDNIYNFKNTEWFVYLIEDMVSHRQLPLDEMLEACKVLGLKTVPIIEKNVKLRDIMPDLDTAVKYAENRFWKPTISEGEFSSIDPFYKPSDGEKLWTDYFQHEGVVVRSVDCDKMRNVGFSFKIKNIDYASRSGKLGEISKACGNLKAKLK